MFSREKEGKMETHVNILTEEEKEKRKQAIEARREEERKAGAEKSKVLLIPTLIFAAITTLFLYDNFSGITMPLFAVGAVAYIRYIYGKLRPDGEVKKGYIFYIIGMVLLAIADTYTARGGLIFYNNVLMFVLIVGLILYMFVDEEGWTITKYLASGIEAVFGGIGCIADMISDNAAAVKYNKNEKTKTLVYCVLGVLIFIPVGGAIIALLCSADAIFDDYLTKIIENFFSLETMVLIPLFFIFVFTCGYCGIRYIDGNKISGEVKDRRVWPIAVANTVLLLIGIVYLLFSGIQIASVFLGQMQLPEGYTYARYIHEGYLQLMVVCFLNLCIVLFTKGFFKNHLSTKLLLTVISICTYIMLASAAIRLAMYIEAYDLTMLRIEVAWSLVMIAICMFLVTVYVYIDQMKLMHMLTGVAVIGLFALSMMRPDELIANYNLHSAKHVDYDYIYELSVDAAPYIAELNYYNINVTEYLEGELGDYKEYNGIRKFNFSKNRAKRYLDN